MLTQVDPGAQPIRAVIYTRQSLDRTGEGQAVARQLADIERLCVTRGWLIVARLEDNDVSATSRKPRPAFQQVLAMIDRREVDVVAVWHVDRLVRRLAELDDVIDRCEVANVTLATVQGDLDLSTDSGRLVGRILASVARGEVERKSTRSRAANLQRAQQGTVLAGGIRTLGYDPGMTRVRPGEATHLRDGFSTILAGGSLREVARRWNTAGFTTAHGGRWDGTSVRTVLRNVRLAGHTKHRGEIVGRGNWQPIITEDVFRAVQDILDDPDRRTTPSTARRYILAGLAVCECGATVITGRTQHGARTYRCGDRRGHMSRAAEPVDEYVSLVMVERLGRPDAASLMVDHSRPNLRALRDEASALRARLAKLSDLFIAGTVTESQLTRGTEDARHRLTAIEQTTADASRLDVLGPLVRARDVSAAWRAAELDSQRAAIGMLCTVHLLSPGRGVRTFRPESVVIAWKAGL